MKYYFTVTAMYKGGESDMSNEISSTNGDIEASPDSSLQYIDSTSTSSGSSGGCFINTLN